MIRLPVKTSIAVVSSLIIMAAPATAFAARLSHSGGGHGGGGTGGTTITLTGNDVSWPQCGKRLPSGQAFGIVGVNAGLANTTNTCFATELAWAEASGGGTSQAKAALYVNTANPGNVVTDWPTMGVNKYGTCSGGDDQACAYQYGWNMAEADAQQRISANNPSNFKWWLDVETNNSWESGQTGVANNVADLEGMVDYFHGLDSSVGLYSTSYQWNQIAGVVSSTSSLYGLDSWLPGASSLSGAENNCSLPGLTGGSTTITQYVSKRIDYDYSCS